MSNENDQDLVQDELQTLKDKADLLGVKYHPSIGIDKLREKVQAALAGKPASEEGAAGSETTTETPEPAPVVESPEAKRTRLREEASRLVRIKLTCMNPAKAEWDGEIITVGNSGVGTFKKFVPFNADDGWHVPHIMYEFLRDRMCQVFTTVTDSRGNKTRRGKLIKEFAIEVLPQLTKEELDELARVQAMAQRID